MSIDRQAAARAIDAFLVAIGRDPAEEPELRGTGERVTDAFVDELCSGYAVDTRSLLASNVIDVAAGGSVVIARDVPVETVCPHHLMVASGLATVAFAPRARLIGIGVVARLVMAHARRLRLQEAIGEAVVADLSEAIEPVWVGCRLVLSHGCMTARGSRAHGARVESVATRGDAIDHHLVHRTLGVGA
jgi:GTP cyclohydrolase IA